MFSHTFVKIQKYRSIDFLNSYIEPYGGILENKLRRITRKCNRVWKVCEFVEYIKFYVVWILGLFT